MPRAGTNWELALCEEPEGKHVMANNSISEADLRRAVTGALLAGLNRVLA